MDSPGAAHDTRLQVVSKEVESTIEYVCQERGCMYGTHNQVGVRKQFKCQRFSNNNCTGFKGEEMSTATEVFLCYSISIMETPEQQL